MTSGSAGNSAGWREQVEAGELAVVRRDDERLRERRDDVAPRGAQHVEEPEHRAERVAVGVHVTGQRDPFGTGDGARSLRRATSSTSVTRRHGLAPVTVEFGSR